MDVYYKGDSAKKSYSILLYYYFNLIFVWKVGAKYLIIDLNGLKDVNKKEFWFAKINYVKAYFFTIDENNIFFNAMNLNMLYKMDFVKEVYLEEVKKWNNTVFLWKWLRLFWRL